MESFHSDIMREFFEAVLLLENADECGKFFEDVCTVKELQDISQRLKVARMLKDGNSYIEVSGQTGASTATISRVNKCLLYGSGGYRTVLDRMSEDKKTER